MKKDLDQDCPSPLELPFNHTIFNGFFELSTPDQDPGGDGFWLLLSGIELLLIPSADGYELPQGDCPLLISEKPPLYIGQWRGRPCRLLEVPSSAEIPPQLLRLSLRQVDKNVSQADISLGGVGAMILHWESSSCHCGHCGHQMSRLPGEWGKECRSCGAHHYPRIHPCVIGLVIKGDEILLARKPEWADGRYSLVAGFVEFGECLEEAMVREVYEETAIKINNVRYLGSQSWPFPSQLMCGFVADYVSGEIELLDGELDDAIWCRLDNLPNLPPKRSIARHIIDRAHEYIS